MEGIIVPFSSELTSSRLKKKSERKRRKLKKNWTIWNLNREIEWLENDRRRNTIVGVVTEMNYSISKTQERVNNEATRDAIRWVEYPV